MKTLLIMADDGISAQVWLHMAKHHLQAGRSVLAITDPQNRHGVIGIGDELPGYGDGLWGHPNFRSLSAGPESVQALLPVLTGLDASTVVMFNMSLFEFVPRDPAWREVVAYCATCPNELVAAYYPPHKHWLAEIHRLAQGTAGPGVTELGSIPWDYVAGSRVLTPRNIEGLRHLIPGLATQIAMPGGADRPADQGTMPWQIINRTGSHELRLVPALTRGNLGAYPALWDVHADVGAGAVRQAAPSPAKQSQLRRVLRAFLDILV